MSTEALPEEPQGEQQTKAPEYYHSINRYWRGPGSPTRRIHHKDMSCRIGGRIKAPNRIAGRRDDTSPCPVCCKDEITDEE